MPTEKRFRSVLVIEGWDEPQQPVVIVRETSKRYRVMAVAGELRLPKGRNGIVLIGRPGTALVPKSAIRFIPKD